MKKFVLVICSVILASFSLKSQDTIYTIKEQKIIAEIIRISDSQIKYRRFDENRGTIYVIPKKLVLVIVYEDGTYEYTRLTPREIEVGRQTEYKLGGIRGKENPEEKHNLRYTNYNLSKKNYLSVNMLNFIHGNINLAYERRLNKNNLYLRIPVKIGFDNENGADYFFPSVSGQKVLYSAELSLIRYIGDMNFISYCFGAGSEWGVYQTLSNYESELTLFSYENQAPNREIPYTSLFGYNGVSIALDKHVRMTLLLGLGPRKALGASNGIKFNSNLSLNFGIMF